MLGPVCLVDGPVIAGYPSDAQWEKSGLLTSPHFCLSSACPRPCLIHRMNFVHISQTSPSTWATQGNSSTQVRDGPPLQPHNHTTTWASPKLPLQIVVTRAPGTHWVGGWVIPELMVHKRGPSRGHLGTITAIRFVAWQLCSPR